jgi:hypothetical protein
MVTRGKWGLPEHAVAGDRDGPGSGRGGFMDYHSYLNARTCEELCSSSYQFVMNKAPQQTLLSSREAGAQAANDKCSWWCLRSNSGGSGSSGSSQTRMPPTSLGIAARWKDQRSTMWRAIGKEIGQPGTPPMAQLFGDERRTAAILEFLATTEVG